MIVCLIVQLISLCTGAYNPQEFLLYILSSVPNKLNALIKFDNKLVSLSTGSRNVKRSSLLSAHSNMCINSASGGS